MTVEDGGGGSEEDAKGGGRKERGAALRALPGISQVAESPTASTGFGSRNNGKREQRGFTATSRRLHWLVVAAFTDNTESTVYRGALWNYEDGTEDGLEKKKKTSSTTTTTTTKMDRVQHRRIKRGSDVRLSFRSSLRFLFPRIFAWIGRGGGAKTRRGIQDKGFVEIPTLLSTR